MSRGEVTDRTSVLLEQMLRNATGEGGKRFFSRDPQSRLSVEPLGRGVRGSRIHVILNTHHWLSKRLKYDARMQRRYASFGGLKAMDEQSMCQFPLWLKSRGEYVTGLGATPLERFDVVYSHHTDSLLSHDIQFVYFEVEDEPFVLLQVCEGKGGRVSWPKAFRVKSKPSHLYDWPVASVEARRPAFDPTLPGILPDKLVWMTEDGGYRWPFKTKGFRGGKNLETYPLTKDSTLRGKGAIMVDDHGAYCPLTGWPLVPVAP